MPERIGGNTVRQIFSHVRADNLAQLEDLLRRLLRIEPRPGAVIEMTVFEGCPIDEIANRLCCQPRIAERRCHSTKDWLRRELTDGAAAG
jgi:DNA-directed RNA polymerase specialized sigma24 family protein